MIPSEPLISIQDWVVPRLGSPQRLDQFLMRQGLHKSRTFIQRLIRGGDVEVNGHSAKTSSKIRPGDRILVRIPVPKPLEILPEAIPLDIVFEDDQLIVLNKPAGLVVHPAPGHYTGTLVHALLYHCRDLSGIGGRERPGVVHRLDKGTTGLMVVAKTDEAHQGLSRQFAAHTVSRTYWALVAGVMKKAVTELDLAIGRDRRNRKKISPRTGRPRRAITTFKVVRRFSDTTWVEARPKTGRTHQIRVHLAKLGHPILGDRVYGWKRALNLENVGLDRPMLHAHSLGFNHPAGGKKLEFEVPLPEDMANAVRYFERHQRR